MAVSENSLRKALIAAMEQYTPGFAEWSAEEKRRYRTGYAQALATWLFDAIKEAQVPVTAAPVTSVFSRSGDVSAQSEDYAEFYQPLGEPQVIYYASLEWKSADLSAQCDGATITFDLPETPAAATTVRLYWNGQRLIPGRDFTVAGALVTLDAFSFIPGAGQALEAEYGITGPNAVLKSSDLSEQCDGETQVFVLPEPAVTGSMRVYRNGQRLLTGVDFAEASASTFELLEGLTPSALESIEVEYIVAVT